MDTEKEEHVQGTQIKKMKKNSCSIRLLKKLQQRTQRMKKLEQSRQKEKKLSKSCRRRNCILGLQGKEEEEIEEEASEAMLRQLKRANETGKRKEEVGHGGGETYAGTTKGPSVNPSSQTRFLLDASAGLAGVIGRGQRRSYRDPESRSSHPRLIHTTEHRTRYARSRIDRSAIGSTVHLVDLTSLCFRPSDSLNQAFIVFLMNILVSK